MSLLKFSGGCILREESIVEISPSYSLYVTRTVTRAPGDPHPVIDLVRTVRVNVSWWCRVEDSDEQREVAREEFEFTDKDSLLSSPYFENLRKDLKAMVMTHVREMYTFNRQIAQFSQAGGEIMIPGEVQIPGVDDGHAASETKLSVEGVRVSFDERANALENLLKSVGTIGHGEVSVKIDPSKPKSDDNKKKDFDRYEMTDMLDDLGVDYGGAIGAMTSIAVERIV